MVPPPLVPFSYAYQSFRNDSTTRLIPFRRRMHGRTAIPSVYVGPLDYFIRNIRKFEELFIMLHDIHMTWTNLTGIVVTGHFVQPNQTGDQAQPLISEVTREALIHGDNQVQRNPIGDNEEFNFAGPVIGMPEGFFDFTGLLPNGDQAQGNAPNMDQTQSNAQNVEQDRGNIRNGDQAQSNAPNMNQPAGRPQNMDQPVGNAPNMDQPVGNASNMDQSHGNAQNVDQPPGNAPNMDQARGDAPILNQVPPNAFANQEFVDYAQIDTTMPIQFLDDDDHDQYRHRYPGQILICVIRAYDDGHIEDITDEMRERFREEHKKLFELYENMCDEETETHA